MDKNMDTIKFIPAIFEDIDYENVETKMCPCSPGFSNRLNDMNSLKINIPEKIFIHSSDDKFIPVCIAYSKSALRILKYHNLSERTIHIKSENGDFKFSGNYFDKRAVNKTPIDVNRLLTAEGLQQRQERINNAQKLSDIELDEGTYSSGYLNVNALDFVNIPIRSGRYEVWVTYYGMESNHAFVEIIIEGDETKEEEEATTNNTGSAADKKFVDVVITNDGADQIPAFLETSFEEDLPEI